MPELENAALAEGPSPFIQYANAYKERMQPAAPVSSSLPYSGLPWAEHFFCAAISTRRLAHAYVLTGRAVGAMYRLALRIARALNCRNPVSGGSAQSLDDMACGQCPGCKWIADNAHPDVLTLSRLTYPVDEKKGEPISFDVLEKHASKNPQTQISTHQIGCLIRQLALSTDAIRTVIFTDAEALPARISADVPAPFDWRSVKAHADQSFHIRPLTLETFNAFSVNRFLKTLEEPAGKTLFFFIAETADQLPETVVSRCQVTPCIPETAEPAHDALLARRL